MAVLNNLLPFATSTRQMMIWITFFCEGLLDWFPTRTDCPQQCLKYLACSPINQDFCSFLQENKFYTGFIRPCFTVTACQSAASPHDCNVLRYHRDNCITHVLGTVWSKASLPGTQKGVSIQLDFHLQFTYFSSLIRIPLIWYSLYMSHADGGGSEWTLTLKEPSVICSPFLQLWQTLPPPPHWGKGMEWSCSKDRWKPTWFSLICN